MAIDQRRAGPVQNDLPSAGPARDPFAARREAQRRLLRECLADERPAMVGLGALAGLQGVATFGFAVAFAAVLAALSGMGTWLPVGWLLGLLAARVVLTGALETASLRLGLRRKYAYKKQLLRVWFAARALPPVEGLGSDLRVFSDGLGKVEVFFQRYVPAAVQMAVVPPLLLAGALWLDWPTALVLVITGPLIPLFMVLIGLAAVAQTRQQWTRLQRMGQTFLDFLRGGLLLRANARDGWAVERIEAASEGFRVSTMKVLAVAFLSALVLELFAMLGVAMVAAQAGVRLVEGWIDFPRALAVLLLAPEFYLAFRTFGARHHAGMEGAESASSLFALLDRRPPAFVPLPRGAKANLPAAEGLEAEGLWFRYDPSSPWVLRDFSFQLPRGEIGAVVGPSGVGKSTLFAVVMGVLAPERGCVRMNGRALRGDCGSNLAAWRREISWVGQDPAFLPGSLRTNLVPDGRDPGEGALREALARVGLEKKLDSLRRGLDSPMAEAAGSWSGGERRRLALARALLKSAPLLLVDEPTASLDPDSERRILDVLQGWPATVLVIAHRPQTLAVVRHRIFLYPPDAP